MAPHLLYLTQTGDFQKSKIIFLHGGGSSSWMWRPVTALLPQYHCIAVDLPQHGKSKDIGPFSIPYAAEKVAELVDFLSPDEPVHLAGLSEGAQVAVQMLATHPELLKSAFISSALLLPVPGAGIFANKWAARWAYRLTLQPFKNWDYWIRLNMKYAAGIPDQYFAHFKQDFQNTTEDSFINLMTANQRFRLPEGLEKVQVPAFIVCGKKEYRAMQDSARLLKKTLPDASLVILNLGKHASLAEEHNWALTSPLQFAGLLRAWVDKNDLPSNLSRQVD